MGCNNIKLLPAKELLDRWPRRRPADWLLRVNQPQDEKELAALRRSRDRGCPYGDGAWALETARRLGIQSSLRPVGRPKLAKDAGKNGL